MLKSNHPLEESIQNITYKGITFEIIKRPDVLWVGCVDYASNNVDESDIAATLNRYRKELIDVAKQDLIHPDWSAALSINYGCEEQPNGLMFAQETYSDKQDKRYDLLTQPSGLWLRICCDKEANTAFFGEENTEIWCYFADQILQKAAEENGYKENPDVYIQLEYHCHADHGIDSYAYIPIIEIN